MSQIATRRWLRIAIGLAAGAVFVVLVWLDTRSKWIADREQARTWIWSHAGSIEDETSVPPAPMPAPWSLRICGETGVAAIKIDAVKMIRKLPASDDRDPQLAARRVQRLFPEATVWIRDLQGQETKFPAQTAPGN